MSSKKTYLILIILLGVMLIALFFGVIKVNSLFHSRAQTLTNTKARAAALEKELQSLKAAKKDIITYSDLEKTTKKIVPEDKDQAETVRQIVNLAEKNGISLESISFPQSNLGGTNVGTVNSSAAAKPVGAAASANPKSKTSSLTQVTAVPSIPGVYSLPITVVSSDEQPVTYSKLINFLKDLENNRRTAQVTTINIDPDPLNRSTLTFTITINEFIKP